MNPNYDLIVILGPTASGKTRLAATLAHDLGSAVISADSRQVYSGMNIGTGKDLEDYTVDHKQVPHHLIDIADAGAKYDLHHFIRDFRSVYEEMRSRQQIPVLCGGTGLYIHAVLSNFGFTDIPVNEQLREQLAGKSKEELSNLFHALPASAYNALADLSTVKRTIRAIEINTYIAAHGFKERTRHEINALVIGLKHDLAIRRQMIADRLRNRLDNGLIEEVENLLHSGLTHEQLEYYGLEYKFVSHFLRGLLSREELEEKLVIAIQQFAKRQMTYFRKMEREGINIRWLDASLPVKQLSAQISGLLNSDEARPA